MIKKSQRAIGEVSFNKPARYQIKIGGDISGIWLDSMRGMGITTEHDENNKTISVLTGVLPDQSALVGILETIFQMRLPILLVKSSGLI